MKTMKFWRLAFAMLAAFRIYTVTDAGHLQISPKPDDTSVALTVDCDIRRLTSTQMIWNKPGTNEEISRFKKVK